MKTPFMNSKELKKVFQILEQQYGAQSDMFTEFAFIYKKERLYIINRDVEKIEFQKLRINSLGLYIGELKNDQLRLSIEGSQIIGKHATKNVCEISLEQLKQWFQGKDIAVSETYEGFVILRHGNDYVGSGKFKEGVILNFVPKVRRLIEIH